MSKGLYANIHARRKAGKKPRPAGTAGRPTDAAFRQAAKTAKKKTKAKV